MIKFLIGVAIGICVAVVVAVIVVFAVARVGERPVSVADGSVLVLKLEGDIPERAPVDLPIPFFQGRAPLTVKEVWDLLRKSAADSRIQAIVLEPAGVNAGWAKLQEIRGSIEKFKKSGKPVIAFLRTPGTREYYLATAADRIYMAPEDYLNVKGLRMELMFLRRTLDKLGVNVEILHAGKYKDFGDTFTRTSMTAETREVLDSVLDDLYAHLIGTIASSRKKTPEEVRALLDEGPFLSNQALPAGLVDALLYEDQVFGELKKRLKASEDPEKVSAREYARITPASLGLEGGPRIAYVVGEGGITRGDSGDNGISGPDGIGSEGFSRLLRRVKEDDKIRGVIVRIDSPGGDSFASDEIWREMNLLSKKKPTVISMSDAAASGGYYISMTGDPVIAYPGTFTGSIGVVFGKANLRGLYDKLGIDKQMLTRGRFADIDTDYTPMTEAQRQKLRHGIDENYRAFVAKVAEARKRPFEEIEPLAQGRVWLGSQARERGLVDELGGLDLALTRLKEKAGIGAEEKVTLVSYPPRRSLIEVLFGQTPSLFESSMNWLGPLKAIKGWDTALWMKGGMMRLMPYRIEVY
ncbi:MAG: signal peptide peptidase SppA [Bryobacteraceae bacterium]